MNNLFLTLMLLSLISCNSSNNNYKKISTDYQDKRKVNVAHNNTAKKTNIKLSNKKLDSTDTKQQSKLIISLNTFTNLPDEIQGCACYFYLTKRDEKRGEYIFVNDFAQISYISINGKLEKFNLINHSDNDDIFLYSNGLYLLKIELLDKKGDGNEGFSTKGVLTLKKGKDTLLKKNFIGDCGC